MVDITEDHTPGAVGVGGSEDNGASGAGGGYSDGGSQTGGGEACIAEVRILSVRLVTTAMMMAWCRYVKYNTRRED
ncbi:hypothetical protein P5673_025949 [Acropora cervicornis]|uniref:Uncharacterized protein n=1 Tax=Acropora cervicornis TaxID=6130 RepID=A0AAD9Q178_ACRCE|nr:hypothetical protein P5673_025949 [Acropora cervicornis]